MPLPSNQQTCRIHYDRKTRHVNSGLTNLLSGRLGTQTTVAPVETVSRPMTAPCRLGAEMATSHNRNERKGRHGTCCNTRKETPSRQVTENCVSSNTGNVPERETSFVYELNGGLETILSSDDSSRQPDWRQRLFTTKHWATQKMWESSESSWDGRRACNHH